MKRENIVVGSKFIISSVIFVYCLLKLKYRRVENWSSAELMTFPCDDSLMENLYGMKDTKGLLLSFISGSSFEATAVNSTRATVIS